MRTLQTYRLLFSFILISTLLVGCDKSATTPPTEKSGANENASDTEAEAASGSKAAPSVDETEPSKIEPATPVELNAPSGQSNFEKTSQVDHNDPTSYPVTKLAEKQDGQLLMLSWNVESDGAEAETVCKELTELNSGDRYDVVALTEVLPEDLKKFRLALGKHYKYAYSRSGRNDRLQILYNEDKFEEVRFFEIKEVNVSGRYRAPLVVHLKERKTDARPDEIEFLVMVNHLARGKAHIRQEQATKLVEWAREQTLPVFGLGDYNFDYVFATDKGNPAFVNFMQDNIWRWVKPTELVDTNWYDNPEEPDGKDDYPGSMLDFAFVAGPAKDWKSSCQIIVRENDFPDDEKTSDHRPFEVTSQK